MSRGERGRRRWLRRWPVVVLIGVSYLIPAALVVWLQQEADGAEDGLLPSMQPIEATASAEDLRDRQPVEVAIETGQRPPVVAPAWNGLVTDVYVSPGQVLQTGDELLQVDGVDRLAYSQQRPFFRSLELDDTGPDVADLRSLLGRLGFLTSDSSSDRYTSAVASGVRRLADAVGVSSDGSSFDPTWLVWLPVEPYEVGTVEVRAGTPVPHLGEPVLVAVTTVTGTSVTSAGAEVDLPGEWVLEIAGREVTLVDGQPTPEASKMLADADADADAAGADIEPADPADPVDAVVTRAAPRRAVTVAASAVVRGSGDGFCVWVPAESGEYEPLEVSVNGGTVSSVEVSGLTEGASYLANPASVLADGGVCP